MQAAVVLSGGENDLHASLEIFSDRPMGIATSTPELIELPTYNSPQHLAVSGDGNRLAVTFATSRRTNLLIFDPPARRIVSSLLVPGIACRCGDQCKRHGCVRSLAGSGRHHASHGKHDQDGQRGREFFGVACSNDRG